MKYRSKKSQRRGGIHGMATWAKMLYPSAPVSISPDSARSSFPLTSNIVNGPSGRAPGQWFTVKNEAGAESAEILIYDQIGRDWYSEDGVTAKDFNEALAAIPQNRKITVRINSPGGNVWDGLAIYHMLRARKSMVTCRVDGLAGSIASIIALGGGSCVMPKNALMMIHEPSTLCAGDSAEMRRCAALLDQHAEVLASVYAEKSGQSAETMRDKMRAETWMTGEDAKKLGLCDTCEENEVALTACLKNFDLTNFRRVPEIIGGKAPAAAPNPNPVPTMKSQILALLRKHGFTVKDDVSDAELGTLLAQLETKLTASAPADLQAVLSEITKLKASITAPQNASAPAQAPANVVDLSAMQAQIDALKKQNELIARRGIEAEIDALITEGKVIAAQREFWIKGCLADAATLDNLRALTAAVPGAHPAAPDLEIKAEDPRTLDRAIVAHFGGGKILTNVEARERAAKRAAIISKHWGQLMQVVNTNTVSTDLKKTVILQGMIRAFATILLPLQAFSSRLGAVRLEGTDKVAVPYFALDTTASRDFDTDGGYTIFGDTNSDSKTVTIDERKYQGLSWTSQDFRRQPFMDVAMGAQLKAEQLARDVFNNVWGIILAASYGAPVKSEPAGSFDSNDVIDLRGIANDLQWPTTGRSLILDTAYDTNILKDGDVKRAFSWGDSTPIREGTISRMAGFDYFWNANLPENGENLAGCIVWKSAVLFAQALTEPTDDVRQQLTQYEAVVEPQTGATFEYRRWGNPDSDASRQIIECSFGKAAGELAALKRITTQ